jgi:hypothetical protein
MGYRKRTDRNTDKITEEIHESIPENVPEAVPEILRDCPTTRAEMPIPEIDDAEIIRKQAIADKRRASLALARSKIIPKSTLKKQADEAVKATAEVIKGKDDEIKIKQEETDAMRLKYERDRVKQLEDSLMTLQKLIADKPSPFVNPPVELPPIKEKYKRPSRAKVAIDKHEVPARQERTLQPEKIIPKKSVEPKITRTSASATPTETLIDKSYGEQLQERLRNQAINKIMNDTFGGF